MKAGERKLHLMEEQQEEVVLVKQEDGQLPAMSRLSGVKTTLL